MHFIPERLAGGTKTRLLTIVDLCSRDCAALGVSRSFESLDVVRTLNHANAQLRAYDDTV